MFLFFILSLVLFILSIDFISKNINNRFSELIQIYIIKLHHNRILLLLIGIFTTMILQSSSLLISLIIILVDHKKISFYDSLFLMMGANIGTCSTAFITSLNPLFFLFFFFLLYFLIYFLFKKKVKVLLGIAMLLISISLLDFSVQPLNHSPFFHQIFCNMHSTLFNLFISSLITGITQSSSAIIATLQTFTANNIINIKTATDMLMGANIGTCITAFIVGMRGTDLAKKCAKFNFVFNLVGVGAFLIFREIIPIYRLVNEFHVKLQIAYIHLLFNLLNVLIYIPFFYKKK